MEKESGKEKEGLRKDFVWGEGCTKGWEGKEREKGVWWR